MPRGRSHEGTVGCPPPILPSRIRPLNTEGAVGVTRRVASIRLAVAMRVAYLSTYLAAMNTAPGAVFTTTGQGEGSLSCRYEYCSRGRREYGPMCFNIKFRGFLFSTMQ